MRVRPFVPLVALAAAVACAPKRSASPMPAPAVAAARAEDAMVAYADALRTATPDSVASFYLPNGELILPGTAPLRGPQAVRAFLAPLAATGEVDSVQVHSDQITVAGPFVYLRGNYREVAGPRGGAHEAFTGRYNATWRLDARGRWRIVRLQMLPNRG